MRIDSHEVDEVKWMRVEDLRKEMSAKFAERSKIAWALYENMNKSYGGQFVPKYFKRDSEALNFEVDPLRSFKLDKQKLASIIYKDVVPW